MVWRGVKCKHQVSYSNLLHNNYKKKIQYKAHTEEAKSSAFSVLASPKSPIQKPDNNKENQHKYRTKLHPKS